MAIVKVSQAGGVATAANTPTGNTGAVGGTFTAGNLLVAIVGWTYSFAGSSITIDVPSGWTAPLATNNNTAPNTGARAYFMPNNPGGPQTWTWNVTANNGATILEWGFTIVEFSGTDSSVPTDLTVIANNNAATATVTVDTLAASGTTLAGDALVQMVFATKSTTPTWSASASSVPTSGWTVGTGFDGTLGSSPFPHLTAMWQTLTGTQAAPRGIMTASTTVSFVTFLFTLKQASLIPLVPYPMGLLGRHFRFQQLQRSPTVSTLFSQTLSVTVTTVPALLKQVSKVLSVTATTSPSLLKQVGKLLSVTTTTTVGLLKQAQKVLSVTSTATVALTKQVNKVLSVTMTATVSLATARVKLVLLSVTTTTVPTITRQVQKLLAVTTTTTPTLQKQIGKLISVVVTTAPAILKRVAKTLSVSVITNPTLAAAKNVLSPVLTVTVTLISRTGRATLLVRLGVVTLLTRTPSLLIRTRIAIVRLLSRSGR